MSEYVLPEHNTTMINNYCPTELFLLVFVVSSPCRFQYRQTIRQTWASVADNHTEVLFLMGFTNRDVCNARNFNFQKLVLMFCILFCLR